MTNTEQRILIHSLIATLADIIHELRRDPYSLARVQAETVLQQLRPELLKEQIAALQRSAAECQAKYPLLAEIYTQRLEIIQRAINTKEAAAWVQMEITLTLAITRIVENGEPKLNLRVHRKGCGTDNMETLADRMEQAVTREMARIGRGLKCPVEVREYPNA